MIRSLLFLACLCAAAYLPAQLSTAHTRHWLPIDEGDSLVATATAGAWSIPSTADLLADVAGTRGPAPDLSSTLTASPFDFERTKPYLAFFCRLELDIEAAARVPVRFRLGEVRSWQQEIGRR